MQNTKPLPLVGPYARLVHDPVRDEWIPRLTEEGRAEVERFMAAYPEPIAFGYRIAPRAVRLLIGRGLTKDDVVSVVLEGVVHGVRRYDPRRGVAVATVIGWAVRAVLYRATEQFDTRGHAVFRFSETWWTRGRRSGDEDADSSATVEDPYRGSLLSDGHSAAERTVVADAVEFALRTLSPADADIVAEHFGLGGRRPRARADIARDTGRSRECVRQKVANAVGRMRGAMDADFNHDLRDRVLAVLKSGPATVREIADWCRVPVETARRHVYWLAARERVVGARGAGEDREWRLNRAAKRTRVGSS